MMRFELDVLQNPYLGRGASEVNAIISVAAADSEMAAGNDEAVELFLIDCSASMTDPPSKLAAARAATARALDCLRDGTRFAVIAGRNTARVVYPEEVWDFGAAFPRVEPALASPWTREEAKGALARLHAHGGTAISTWLATARRLFESQPTAIHHALLLTDGKNEGEPSQTMRAELQRCLGAFECDCRAVGTNWDRRELQTVSDALLGTTDIIPQPSEMAAEFEAIVQRTMAKRVGSTLLHVLTPVGGGVAFLKQVAPEVIDLTRMASWMQPGASGEWRLVAAPDPRLPLLSLYPISSWSVSDTRDYHIRLEIAPHDVGDRNEVRAARISLGGTGVAAGQAPVRAIWTDDVELFTRIHPAVAHYTGQAELARIIEEGLEARRAGDVDSATRKLGRAVQLASGSGNDGTRRLLLGVVDVDDAARGTVRLKPKVSAEAEMTLDTRSRRTVRLVRPGEDG
jgi:hypothetical protein